MIRLTGGTNNSAGDSGTAELAKTTASGFAAISALIAANLDLLSASNDISQSIADTDFAAQLEDIKNRVDTAFLTATDSIYTGFGEYFTTQSALLTTGFAGLMMTGAMIMIGNTLDTMTASVIASVERNAILNSIITSSLSELDSLAAINAVLTAFAADTAANLAINSAFLPVITGDIETVNLTLWTIVSHLQLIETYLQPLNDTLNTTNQNTVDKIQSLIDLETTSQGYQKDIDTSALNIYNFLGTNLVSKLDSFSDRLDAIVKFTRLTNETAGIIYLFLGTNYVSYMELLFNTLNAIVKNTTDIKAAVEDSTLAEEANRLARIGNDYAFQANVMAAAGLAFSTIGLMISCLATGGIPSTGQMFVAREAGPELVGTIGGRSAVANNSQIVEAVSGGVARAVASVLGNSSTGNVQVYIGNDQLDSYIVKSGRRQALLRNGAYA